jgi:hypothetical protein
VKENFRNSVLEGEFLLVSIPAIKIINIGVKLFYLIHQLILSQSAHHLTYFFQKQLGHKISKIKLGVKIYRSFYMG